MDANLPDDWTESTRRSYTPADSTRKREYRTYRHDSGDVRLKVAPASLGDGGDRPGYTLTATSYPGLEFAQTTRVRTVLTFDRCEQVARRFMTLFTGRYDGPGSFDAALEYACKRTREPPR
ncbi:hypothetical protein [Natronobacterium gregoryi]|uniref:Uncharacterized protein n=2 Tax=Natronobacterium gregoryi TaxID=44930 RepID=L0AFW4_NATGS|nr:hypothetical protein [Natronobacterium gregoryi]AFZ72696.1 hypothetical protein Natgr_1487 [Natronobacterium gregoryi SP2]ELY69011.1 hypothetical protein C490_08471 [Natronobacterium gregoryi SP2]PLK20647.1 hypothetical protein CYV19_08605 [Natronobacterium gregoryi SP2]SFI91895.1 hypothetical protein SAMN05443661_10978 [Natronobacterium gregoryi]